MKRTINADKVVSARLSDTGDAVQVTFADDDGQETVISLPAMQLGLLAGWLDQAASRLGSAAPSDSDAKRQPPIFPIEWWTVRPEPDEEHLVLGFRMPKGMELALRIHRNAAANYAQALTSLLGGFAPGSPSKAKH